MANDTYEKQWRFRINVLRVFFLDGYGKLIPNHGSFEAGLFKMEVLYPNYFYDMDKNKVGHLFAAHQFYCRSTYLNDGEFVEKCEVADEFDFDANIFASSPNGTFTMNLLNSHALNMTRFQKLKIEISGSYAPILSKDSKKNPKVEKEKMETKKIR